MVDLDIRNQIPKNHNLLVMPQEYGSARYADMQLRKRRGGFNVVNNTYNEPATDSKCREITNEEVLLKISCFAFQTKQLFT
jgi:hypothetical protein